jgi:primosomal protein N'
LVYVGVIGRDRRRVAEAAQRYAGAMRDAAVGDVLGPAPYPIARVNNEWRYRIALRGRRPAVLRRLVRERVVRVARTQHATRVAINVDP